MAIGGCDCLKNHYRFWKKKLNYLDVKIFYFIKLNVISNIIIEEIVEPLVEFPEFIFQNIIKFSLKI